MAAGGEVPPGAAVGVGGSIGVDSPNLPVVGGVGGQAAEGDAGAGGAGPGAGAGGVIGGIVTVFIAGGPGAGRPTELGRQGLAGGAAGRGGLAESRRGPRAGW